ncbi:M48 family metallopeptidase [Pseudomarimonas arenosa]|uniref:M48 family metalloprotease n=1 Tax=Pseudomarimonas arenosa TaxID=2774145 RepID=A0AAW3ZRF7_9GAMM|nr:M48 family metallopeptidase [Pseudomarimonas arenosa]MBD8527664.1 M48 family metalloprotease [Pseudomarimonas arenosa]
MLAALLAVFLIPGITYSVAGSLRAEADRQFLESARAQVARTPTQALASARTANEIAALARMASARDAEAQQWIERHVPSTACVSKDPELAEYRAEVCERFSLLWQALVAERLSGWTLAGGAALLGLIGVLASLAFASRGLQALSFVLGWRVLVLASAALVTLQAAFAAWLSYALTIYLVEGYYPKLVLLVGIVAVAGALHALFAIFKRVRFEQGVHGHLLTSSEARKLWLRVRQLAAQIRTSPPAQIIAGIDANFFVTEQPLQVAGQTVSGRTLFVSLPLLRTLDQAEADAVLAHELGHFAGGDTASSAILGPKLHAFDAYHQAMAKPGLNWIAFALLGAYRWLFELAMSKSSREREFEADRVASTHTSGMAVARALIKVTAYASYRSSIENELFKQNDALSGRLGIGDRVASGLPAFSRSAQFLSLMRDSEIPHPFDSHPPLQERMTKVGCRIAERDYANIVCKAPAESWVDAINEADQVELRLWNEFESEFSAQHEVELAYRYLPSNETERELVERHFPPLTFALKADLSLEVSHAGMRLPNKSEIMSWDDVQELGYEDAVVGADILSITHPKRTGLPAEKTRVPLSIASKDRPMLKRAIESYWNRHRAARMLQGQMQPDAG